MSDMFSVSPLVAVDYVSWPIYAYYLLYAEFNIYYDNRVSNWNCFAV